MKFLFKIIGTIFKVLGILILSVYVLGYLTGTAWTLLLFR